MLEYMQAAVNYHLGSLVEDERGQTAVEYALVLVLVAIILAGVLATLSGSLTSVVDKIESALGVA